MRIFGIVPIIFAPLLALGGPVGWYSASDHILWEHGETLSRNFTIYNFDYNFGPARPTGVYVSLISPWRPTYNLADFSFTGHLDSINGMSLPITITVQKGTASGSNWSAEILWLSGKASGIPGTFWDGVSVERYDTGGIFHLLNTGQDIQLAPPIRPNGVQAGTVVSGSLIGDNVSVGMMPWVSDTPVFLASVYLSGVPSSKTM